MADRGKMSAGREAMLERMRKKMNEQKSGGRDPEEFRPDNVKPGQTKDYYFYVLFPNDGEDMWFVENGSHWIDRRPYTCPRVSGEGDCPVCQLGFDLIEGVEDKETRSKIGKKFFPATRYGINILFTDDKDNGEYANRVMWYNAPNTVIKKMQEAFLRESAGDNPNKPQAFGDFFNPSASYMFNLSVSEKSGYNNYDASDFLAHAGTKAIPEQVTFEKGGKKTTGDPLDFRHDLRSKIDPINMDFLNEYVEKFDGASDGQFEDEEKSTRKPESSKSTRSETRSDAKTEVKTETKSEPVKSEAKAETKSEPAKAETKVDVEQSGDDDKELENLLNELS